MAGGRTLNVDALTAVLNGSPAYQETLSTVTSGAAQKNATAFIAGTTIAFQSDQAVYFTTGDATVVCAAASAFQVPAGQITVLVLPTNHTYISFIAASTSANIKLARMV